MELVAEWERLPGVEISVRRMVSPVIVVASALAAADGDGPSVQVVSAHGRGEPGVVGVEPV